MMFKFLFKINSCIGSEFDEYNQNSLTSSYIKSHENRLSNQSKEIYDLKVNKNNLEEKIKLLETKLDVVLSMVRVSK